MENNVRIFFQINPTSGVPIYRQIIDQVKIGIALGRWKAGDFLPSVREVSAGVEVNQMTVSKAYSLLEKAGVIEFVRGQGMRVPAVQAPNAQASDAAEQLAPLLTEVVNRARQLSLEKDQVVAKLGQIWEGPSHE